MKFSTILSAAVATFATLSSAQSQLFTVQASYTDELVDVGDLDTFWSVWTRMYDQADDHGGLSDWSASAFNRNCQWKHDKPRLTTRFILDGQWGAVNGLTGWQMRDALITSMWATVEELGKQQSYPVYRECASGSFAPGHTWAACGEKASTRCPGHGACDHGGDMECQEFRWGHHLPSIIRINVYNPDGSLRADAYQARISTTKASEFGGCGKSGAVAEVLSSFIPGVGSIFEKGIKIMCRNGSF